MVRPLQRKLWRDIGRNKPQFIAITLTIFLGVTIFGATYDSFQNLQASYDQTAVEYRFANLTTVGGNVAAIAAHAEELPEAEYVATRTTVDVPFRVDDTKLLGRTVGLPATEQPPVNQIDVLSGSYLSDGSSREVLVEEHMADHFDLIPGDSFELLIDGDWAIVTVTGIVASPEYIWPARDRQEIITTPDNFGVVFVTENLAHSFEGSLFESLRGVYH